jgi:hypothetical protein
MSGMLVHKPGGRPHTTRAGPELPENGSPRPGQARGGSEGDYSQLVSTERISHKPTRKPIGKAPPFDVYLGRTFCGSAMFKGGGWEAYDAAGQRIGLYPDRDSARCAIWRAWGRE